MQKMLVTGVVNKGLLQFNSHYSVAASACFGRLAEIWVVDIGLQYELTPHSLGEF